MSELHKFIFDGLPVRGMVVRLTEAWQEILRRRAGNTATGAYPPPVRELLGEMAAAGVLMQGNIKFNGALVLQIFGDGPIKVAVAEVRPDLSLRATATVVGEVPHAAALSQMVNVNNQGRCAITLDPKDRLPGQQAYQGVVPLFGDRREPLEKLSDVLEHYMLQSEQLDTTLVLAADEQVAAGLLIQRLPMAGGANLAGEVLVMVLRPSRGNVRSGRFQLESGSGTRERGLFLGHVGRHPFEQRRGEIALTSVGEHAADDRTFGGALGDLHGDGE